MNKLILVVLFNLLALSSFAQNSRITDPNTIGWLAYNGTIKLNKKWGIHTEVHLRRDRVVSKPQQNLYRTGINFSLNSKISFRGGYALAETYNYGDIPINNLGKQFTEHRIFQMATLNDKSGILEFSHRFMLEQRWIERYSSTALSKEDEFVYWNRLRYMFRTNIPLKGKTISDKTPYLAVYDEILIGFGKNVNENIFDQNRLALLFGYRFSPKLRIEGGYLNQVVQLSREVNNRNVFQDNKGILISTALNF